MESLEERFDDTLDEVYPIYIMGQTSFRPSEILKQCDPIAYRIGLSEFEEFFGDEENE
jgi:hypothetical protein